MLPRKKNFIIFVKKEELTVGVVSMFPNVSLEKEITVEWDQLDEMVKALKLDYDPQVVRLLLSDEMLYRLEFEMELDEDGMLSREAVFEKLEDEIPQKLSDHDWDFKVLGETDVGVEVVAFAPVLNPYKRVLKALIDKGIAVEAVEPERFSKNRHTNPIVGLAIKEDLEGADEDVLNIQRGVSSGGQGASDDSPETLEESEIEEEDVGSQPRSTTSSSVNIPPGTMKTSPFSFSKRYLLILGVVAFFLSFLSAAYVLNWGFFGGGEEEAVVEEVVVEEDSEATPSAEAEMGEASPSAEVQEDIDPADYTLNVQNGSGIPGEAGRVSGLLQEEGFQIGEVGNADTFNYVDTIVRLKEGAPDQLFNEVEAILGGEFNVVMSTETLAEDSDADALVIIGEQSAEE